MKKMLLLVLSLVLLTPGMILNAQETQNTDTVETTVSKPVKKSFTKAEKDSILFDRLSAEQLLQLRKEEMEVERRRIEANNEIPLGSVAIVLIVMSPFIFVVILVLLSIRHKNKESQRKYELYLKSLEMGQTIPDNFFAEPKQQKKSNLQKGIILLMVGLAFAVAVIILKKVTTVFLLAAIIPSFIGIGYLLIHFLEKKNETDATAIKENEQS